MNQYVQKVTRRTPIGDVQVEISDYGVFITLPGYSTKTAVGDDAVVGVTYSDEDTSPVVWVWNNINEEEPTDRIVISDNAKNEARIEDDQQG